MPGDPADRVSAPRPSLEGRVKRWRTRLTVVAVLGAFGWFLVTAVNEHGQHDAFGRADIPSRSVVHLPSGHVDVFYKEVLDNESFDVWSAPSVTLGVEPADNDGPPPPVQESHGKASKGDGDAHELVFGIGVPRETDYRITADGDVNGRESPEFLFGRSGRPWLPLAIGGGGVIAIWIVSKLLLAGGRRLRPA